MGADGFFSLERERQIRRGTLSLPEPDPALAENAALGFSRAFPGQSAMTVLQREQAGMMRRLSLMVGVSLLLAPALTIQMVMWTGLALFSAILVFRTGLVLLGCLQARRPPQTLGADLLLPVYTILVALKDEAASAAQLSRAILALDYPSDRIDLKLLIETGDEATRDALLDQDWPDGTELIVLPPGLPRTKPRALNYGLARARGAYVVVYDAEDRPDPRQLREAAAAFARGPSHLACVQAPLVGVPAGGGWLPAQWALEYAIQFGRILPALARLGLPIALGGTSNHFHRAKLVEAGGWDAWNVTEDADLGLRLARRGARVSMIAPPTLEAPPERMGVWLAQRSRWLKGFLQTWLVLMRTPAASLRDMGLAGFVSMQLTLGAAILSASVHGPWAVWCLFCLCVPDVSLGPLGTGVMLVSYVAGVVTGVAAPGGWGRRSLIVALTAPLYWPLQSVAMTRALYGLCHAPHFWAKTPHGAPSA
jgi:Glycosyl transferase family group 2